MMSSSNLAPLPPAEVPDEACLHRLRGLLSNCLGKSVGPLRAVSLRGGLSHATHRLTDGSSSWVLRSVTESAPLHREYRVLTALRNSGVPIPTPLAFCDDDNVLGRPFLLLEWVDGTVHHTAGAGLTAQTARDLSLQVVDTLVRLHRLPPPPGLGAADPAKYLIRQLDRWRRLAPNSLDGLFITLRATVPQSGPAALIHGDYHPGNIVFRHGAPASVAAVLDWELATIGDPLADLGLLIACWAGPGDPRNPLARGLEHVPGLLTCGEMAEHYARRTGADLTRLPWYVRLAQVKAALLLRAVGDHHAGPTGSAYPAADVAALFLDRALTSTPSEHQGDPRAH
jgi:aminoglycoside phosphotransferase (APT) family kinase protein